MVVYIVNFIFIFTIFNATAIASENNNSLKNNIILLATNQVQNSVTNLANTIKKCEAKKTLIRLNSLSLPKISKNNLAIAFNHLSSNATKHCESGQWEKLSFSLGNYNNVISHFKSNNRIIFKYQDLINIHAWRDFKLKLQYKNISLTDRKIIESNQHLLAPFDSMKLVKEILNN